MQDPLHGTINKLTLAAASAAGASATLDATDGGGDAGASTGGMRRPYIAPGMSDPMGELPVLNAKYITNCEELHLAGKDIRKLAHFGRSEQSGFVSPGFVNLNVLWLNNNVLRKIGQLQSEAERDKGAPAITLEALEDALSNLYTRSLAGRDAFHLPAAELTRDHLEIAKQRLAKFAVVLTLEELPAQV